MQKLLQTLTAFVAVGVLLIVAACGSAPSASAPPVTPTTAPKAVVPTQAPAAKPAPTQAAVSTPAVGKVVATAAPKVATKYTAAPPMTIDVSKVYVATIETDKGNIVMELYPADAPQHVNNFVFLAKEGFYNGLTFHRVEPGFVIQGGDPLGNGTGGLGYMIPAEIKRKHPEGALAQARNNNPEKASSGSQFYITLAATPNLDGGYTSYGQVVQGMDVVKKIAIGDKIKSISVTVK